MAEALPSAWPPPLASLPSPVLTSPRPTHAHLHGQLDHVPQGLALLWAGGQAGRGWVEALTGTRLPHPAHLTSPTFLVLYSDRQMETEEMRKMHRAYQ